MKRRATSLSFLIGFLCLPAHRAEADSALVHVVRQGDTLASIAERYYGDPRRENVLVAENGLTSEGGSAIVVGLRLSVPAVGYHQVQQGETWHQLAREFYGDARRVFVLLEANGGVPGTQPDPGAVLLIPYPLRHVASQDETLRSVARAYYGPRQLQQSMRVLRLFNHTYRVRLQRGQIILVPLPDLVLSEKGRELAQKQGDGSPMQAAIRAKQAEIEAALPQLRQHLRDGHYEESVALGNDLLGHGDLTGNQIVTIQRQLGIAFVALAREDLAIQAFKAALEKQPDLELDSARTSPKVLAALQKARAQFSAERAAQAEQAAEAAQSGQQSEQQQSGQQLGGQQQSGQQSGQQRGRQPQSGQQLGGQQLGGQQLGRQPQSGQQLGGQQLGGQQRRQQLGGQQRGQQLGRQQQSGQQLGH